MVPGNTDLLQQGAGIGTVIAEDPKIKFAIHEYVVQQGIRCNQLQINLTFQRIQSSLLTTIFLVTTIVIHLNQ